MGRSNRIGEAGLHINVGRPQLAEQIVKKRRFAAEEMRSTANIDEKTIRRIDGNNGAVTTECPKAQPADCRRVGGGIGGFDMKAGHPGLRLRQRKTWPHAMG